MKLDDQNTLRDQTIADFGDQWTKYTNNDGFYGSVDLLDDILYPFINHEELKELSVAEIGSGSGRIVTMLSNAGAKKITAIEPSEAFSVLRENTKELAAEMSYVNAPGEAIENHGPFDMVFSIGVLHHIPQPEPVVSAALNSLRPNGKMLIWLYGAEGNSLYLALLNPLRALVKMLPCSFLPVLTWLVYIPFYLYMLLCKALPLPLRDYIVNVIGKMAPDKQRLVIYDQLNPAYAKYYNREEAIALLKSAGFVEVKAHHRRGYSWTVIGTKPNLLPGNCIND